MEVLLILGFALININEDWDEEGAYEVHNFGYLEILNYELVCINESELEVLKWYELFTYTHTHSKNLSG